MTGLCLSALAICLGLTASTVPGARLFVHAPREIPCTDTVLLPVDRVLVQSARLLRPTKSGLLESDPIDILIEDGRIAQVGSGLISQLEPGQLALRRPELWLLPAPRVLLRTKNPSSSDLIGAGLHGAGVVGVFGNQPSSEALLARAELDGPGLPILEVVDVKAEPVDRRSFDIAVDLLSELQLPTEAAAVQELLDSMASRPSDPFLPGAPARFLALDSDPRDVPSSLSDPFAIVQGSDLVLKSERLVRLEELAAFHALEPPSFKELGWPVNPSSKQLYRILIGGLPRGYVQVAAWQDHSNETTTVRVAERIAAPLEEEFEASVQWPQGSVECSWRVQNRRVQFQSSGSGSAEENQLQIIPEKAPLEPMVVALQAQDQFLPHTLLILFDALADPSSGATQRIVEVDILTSPVSTNWSARSAPRAVPKQSTSPLLGLCALRAQHRSPPGQLRALPLGVGVQSDAQSTADPSLGLLFCTGANFWPDWLLLETPWGIVEWRSEPRSQP
ncbi:MAG: hypothetical protein CBC35_00655 [Planctomycetes bacterium TMED75]|nr:hypothetical protein [Planctomycetaceae bacterium]OUU96772.1 MAG: hypothetical protein CBC35_00655 [Planctomycetes bacterium TMED75]